MIGTEKKTIVKIVYQNYQINCQGKLFFDR
jgi:hypothetical protein